MKTQKQLKYEECQINTDSNKTPVYVVENGCNGYEHIITFDFDKAYEVFIREIQKSEYPYIKVIEVEK